MVSVSVLSPQTSFFLQCMVINTDTLLVGMQSSRTCGVLSPIWDIHIMSLYPKLPVPHLMTPFSFMYW